MCYVPDPIAGHSNEDKNQWPLVVGRRRKIIKQRSKTHSVLENGDC